MNEGKVPTFSVFLVLSFLQKETTNRLLKSIYRRREEKNTRTQLCPMPENEETRKLKSEIVIRIPI